VEKLREPQAVYIVEDNFPTGALDRIRTAVASGQKHRLLDRAMVGAGNQPAVIVEGRVLAPDYEKTQDSERVDVPKECVKRSTQGKKECIKWKAAYSYYVYTISETCTHGFHAKISDGSSAQVLQERDFVFSDSKEAKRKDKWPNVVGADVLCGNSFSAAVAEFQKSFVPYRKVVSLTFVDIDDCEDANRAIEAAELGNMERSKGLFLEAVKDAGLPEESRAWARYDLAVIYEALDEFPECLEQLDLASEVLGSDSKIIALKQSCER